MTTMKDLNQIAEEEHFDAGALLCDASFTTSGQTDSVASNQVMLSHKSTAGTHKILYPMPDSSSARPTINWCGLTAFDMVEKIASMAISKSKLRQTTLCPEEPPGYSFLQYLADGSSVAPRDITSGSGQKRKRADDDYDEDDSSECELVVASVLGDVGDSDSDFANAEMTPWKPSAMINDWTRATQRIIADDTVLIRLNHLDSIVASFEKLMIAPMNKDCISSYSRVQSMFLKSVETLNPNANERVLSLLDLTVQQMQALTEMVQPMTHTTRVKFASFVSINRDGHLSTLPMSKPNPTRIMNDIVLSESPLDEKAKRKVFNAYLTEWLCQKQNWLNPYPDATMLRQMASHFIHLGCVPGVNGVVTETEAIGKINTWLLNTRTRQWRPAVEEAFDNKRPAMLLMEDSMRIFKGDELRPLLGWDCNALFADRGDYSEPVSTWGKRGSKPAVKETNNNAKAVSDGNDTPTPCIATLDGFGLSGDDALFVGEAGEEIMRFAAV